MTNQPTTTAFAPATQNPTKKTERLKIKLGEPRIWNPAKPCQVLLW